MARPRKATSELFYDQFADWDLSDQSAALRVLEQVHRLALRESKRRNGPKVDADPLPLLDEGGTEDADA